MDDVPDILEPYDPPISSEEPPPLPSCALQPRPSRLSTRPRPPGLRPTTPAWAPIPQLHPPDASPPPHTFEPLPRPYVKRRWLCSLCIEWLLAVFCISTQNAKRPRRKPRSLSDVPRWLFWRFVEWLLVVLCISTIRSKSEATVRQRSLWSRFVRWLLARLCLRTELPLAAPPCSPVHESQGDTHPPWPASEDATILPPTPSSSVVEPFAHPHIQVRPESSHQPIVLEDVPPLPPDLKLQMSAPSGEPPIKGILTSVSPTPQTPSPLHPDPPPQQLLQLLERPASALPTRPEPELPSPPPPVKPKLELRPPPRRSAPQVRHRPPGVAQSIVAPLSSLLVLPVNNPGDTQSTPTSESPDVTPPMADAPEEAPPAVDGLGVSMLLPDADMPDADMPDADLPDDEVAPSPDDAVAPPMDDVSDVVQPSADEPDPRPPRRAATKRPKQLERPTAGNPTGGAVGKSTRQVHGPVRKGKPPVMVSSPGGCPPRKDPPKKQTQAERLAALSTPRIRDERITPGCHKYKAPVRGLAYRGSIEGTTYQHRTKGLAQKDTDGKAIHLQDARVKDDRDAYNKHLAEEMKKQVGPSNPATGKSTPATGKQPNTGGSGAFPSSANATATQRGSEPGRLAPAANPATGKSTEAAGQQPNTGGGGAFPSSANATAAQRGSEPGRLAPAANPATAKSTEATGKQTGDGGPFPSSANTTATQRGSEPGRLEPAANAPSSNSPVLAQTSAYESDSQWPPAVVQAPSHDTHTLDPVSCSSSANVTWAELSPRLRANFNLSDPAAMRLAKLHEQLQERRRQLQEATERQERLQQSKRNLAIQISGARRDGLQARRSMHLPNSAEATGKQPNTGGGGAFPSSANATAAQRGSEPGRLAPAASAPSPSGPPPGDTEEDAEQRRRRLKKALQKAIATKRIEKARVEKEQTAMAVVAYLRGF